MRCASNNIHYFILCSIVKETSKSSYITPGPLLNTIIYPLTISSRSHNKNIRNHDSDQSQSVTPATTTPNLSQESNYSDNIHNNNFSTTQPLPLDFNTASYLNLCAIANEDPCALEESLQMDDLIDVVHVNEGEEQSKTDEVVSETEAEADDSTYCSTEDNQSDDEWFDEDLTPIDDVIGEIQDDQRLTSPSKIMETSTFYGIGPTKIERKRKGTHGEVPQWLLPL